MTRKTFALAVLASAAAVPAAAQTTPQTMCDGLAGTVMESCALVAQAVDAFHPQLGILAAGGNPTLGTASTGGVRLGRIPRVSVGARLNLVGAALPDILGDDAGAAGRLRMPLPAVGVNATLGLTSGMSLAPMVGGVGAVDLLASGSWLPFSVFGVDGFAHGSSPPAIGVGGRVGLLRESFVTPGVSVSVMYRAMPSVGFGDACYFSSAPSPDPAYFYCFSEGDMGQFEFDLRNVSTRAVVSKRLLGFGLTAGLGHDRFSTDALMMVRGESEAIEGGPATRVYFFEDVRVRNDRWSVFGNASYTLLVGSLIAELGMMQGSDPVPGFPTAEAFNPRDATIFGSLGARLAF